MTDSVGWNGVIQRDITIVIARMFSFRREGERGGEREIFFLHSRWWFPSEWRWYERERFYKRGITWSYLRVASGGFLVRMEEISRKRRGWTRRRGSCNKATLYFSSWWDANGEGRERRTIIVRDTTSNGTKFSKARLNPRVCQRGWSLRLTIP